MRSHLEAATQLGLLRRVDLYFALRMQRLAGRDSPALLLAAALASHRVGQGDVCLDLRECAEFPLFAAGALQGRLRPPAAADWRRALESSPVVGRPGNRAPLILSEAGRLYLGRYWQFEHDLAEALKARAGQWFPGLDRERLARGLDRLFPSTGETDWQRVAAAMAVLRSLCVISGGPGTGKTRTVASILALLVEQSPNRPPRIALAAPTGKAAARLTEAIRGEKATLRVPLEVREAIPDGALTLHRLLGFRPGRCNPRHGRHQPLHLDALVVDEASMVDLPLMARLLEALPAAARLILLGDKDQLASVEAGMVLGDICGRGAEVRYSTDLRQALEPLADTVLPASAPGPPSMADHLVVLRRSYRFGAQSGIGALAARVNAGDGAGALALLRSARHEDIALLPPEAGQLNRLLEQGVLPLYRRVLQAEDAEHALGVFNRLRVLCAVREGPYGVKAVNRLIESVLRREGLLDKDALFYPGRPLMVTMNDHAQRLYNGDVGLVLQDPDSGGALRVFFDTPEGIRRVLPSRLPAHETVYAMTVHKSQGSEFAEVILVLPESDSRVLSRELIYTGITRARARVVLLSTPERLEAAAARRVSRASGLYHSLWSA